MNRRQLLTSMCFENVCLANKQWLAYGQARVCRSGNPPNPTPPLLLLFHQCPTQRSPYTHPAFVGQECQEFRLLPNKVLSAHLPLCPISPQ